MVYDFTLFEKSKIAQFVSALEWDGSIHHLELTDTIGLRNALLHLQV